jgi:hypothetical protein
MRQHLVSDKSALVFGTPKTSAMPEYEERTLDYGAEK